VTLTQVLWTGGWDSTFRILQLSRRDVIVQPYYLLCERNSERFELDAISTITRLIRNRKSTVCTLEDVITVPVNESEEHQDISNSYNSMSRVRKFGIQYDWLARLAREINGLELAIHQDDKAVIALNAFGRVKKIQDEQVGEYFVLDPANSSPEARRVFGNFRFPLLEHTKVTMKEEAEAAGLMDIMNRTWFCYFPVNGQPCGICNPCIYTIDEGLSYRFDKVAMRRYRARKNRESLRRLAEKTGFLSVWRYFKSFQSKPAVAQ